MFIYFYIEYDYSKMHDGQIREDAAGCHLSQQIRAVDKLLFPLVLAVTSVKETKGQFIFFRNLMRLRLRNSILSMISRLKF
jgi:hypothetical protein